MTGSSRSNTVPMLLIVDDDPDVVYSLEKSLQSRALDIVTANTARDGVQLVRERHPSAVVLDVRLPDMSGLDAFDRIREIDPRLPVVVIIAAAKTVSLASVADCAPPDVINVTIRATSMTVTAIARTSDP